MSVIPEPCAASTLPAEPSRLGEGPLFDPDLERLFWLDILQKRLLEVALDGSRAQVHALPFMASMIARAGEGRHLLAAEDGLYLREYATGELHLVRPLEAENRDTRSNDGRVHPSGSLWIGTMGKEAEHGAGAIYWFRKGELRRLYDGITIPNSICFSPDGTRAYFTDTAENIIKVVEVDAATGLPVSRPREFVRVPDEHGKADGSIIDAHGNLWNAKWGAGRLDIYDQSGHLAKSWKLPVKQPTCPAVAGKSADRVIITSAYDGLQEHSKAGEAESPMDGVTFLLEARIQGMLEPLCLVG